MRRIIVAMVGIVTLVGGLAVWRSPTAALVSLKLALDRRDLSAVERALDYRALTDAALARLVEGHQDEPQDVRLVLRGENAWIPTISSARSYLRMRLERGVEQVIEDPEHSLGVTWEDVRRALTTLRRSGSVARFRVPGRQGEEYIIRMRQGRGRWRIFAIDRDGEPVLLTPPERESLQAALDGDATAGNGNEPPQEEEVAAAEVVPEAHLGALVDESSELLRVRPAPRPRSGRQSPFIRRLDDGTWTVQVGATVDAIEADLERQWYESSGEPAFVQTAEVSGRVWQRVLIGRYPARADAMQTLARLTDAGAEVSARR
jgi:hypothetical protein